VQSINVNRRRGRKKITVTFDVYGEYEININKPKLQCYTFSFPTALILWTLGLFNVFILLSSWICLHDVLD